MLYRRVASAHEQRLRALGRPHTVPSAQTARLTGSTRCRPSGTQHRSPTLRAHPGCTPLHCLQSPTCHHDAVIIADRTIAGDAEVVISRKQGVGQGCLSHYSRSGSPSSDLLLGDRPNPALCPTSGSSRSSFASHDGEAGQVKWCEVAVERKDVIRVVVASGHCSGVIDKDERLDQLAGLLVTRIRCRVVETGVLIDSFWADVVFVSCLGRTTDYTNH